MLGSPRTTTIHRPSPQLVPNHSEPPTGAPPLILRDVGLSRSRSTEENTEGGRSRGRKVDSTSRTWATTFVVARVRPSLFPAIANASDPRSLPTPRQRRGPTPHDNEGGTNTTVGQPTTTRAAQR